MFEFIVEAIAAGGYAGIFLLMFLENIVPPIPSELIMPLAGFVAARGELSFPLVVIAGTAGSVAGALPWYFAGAKLGLARMGRFADRHGRWLTISRDNVESASAWYRRHGKSVTAFGRIIPAVRTLISVPAGVVRMPLPLFLLCSTLGSLVWVTFLTSLGFVLKSQYEVVGQYMDKATHLVLALIVLAYAYRLIRWRKPQATDGGEG